MNKICPAESTPFEKNTFDLVTVAQAYHWIKWKEFKKEVTRVCKPNAVIAVWMYYNPTTGDEQIDTAIRDFYENVTKPYWDYERRYVEDLYETVEFGYDLLSPKKFATTLNWERKDLLGYISSWSAIQKYIKANNHPPIIFLLKDLKKLWPTKVKKQVTFPIYLKLGMVVK